jgi:hypothetical protein
MKKYDYVILSNDEGTRTVLNDNPIGWENVKFSLIRDFIYLGVFKSISAEFDFVGDGYQTLQKLYLRYGVDADALLRIYENKEFFFEAKLNFVNFEDDRKLAKVKIDLIQSSFVQDFQNREDIQINLLADKTLDLADIDPIPYVTATIRGKQLLLYSEWFTEPLNPLNLVDAPFEIYHHLVPFELVKNDNPNVKNVAFIDTTDTPTDEFWQATNGFYTNLTTSSQTFDIVFNFKPFIIFLGDAKLIPDNGTRLDDNVVRYRIDKIDANGDYIESIFEREFVEVTGIFTVSDLITATLEAGESLIFVCYRLRKDNLGYAFLDAGRMDGSSILNSSYRTQIYYIEKEMTVQDNSIYEDTECPVFLPFEVFQQAITLLTGKTQNLYSEHFGRTDLGYDADGRDSLLGITNGLLLRGTPLAEVQMKMSFRDIFQSYNAIASLGMTITNDLVTIEPKTNLFNKNIATSIGEVSNLKIRPSGEFVFNSVKAGFPYYEYEETNGTDEFNTTVVYTNSIKSIKNELDIVSLFRGDGYGIELTRRESLLTTGTKDTKADRDIFFIDLIRDEGGFITRRLEDIENVSGILNPQTAFNLRISPSQNLLNWGAYLAIPITRKTQQEYFFQSKDKNNNLSISTALGTTTDKENLIIEDNPFFIPEYREFKAPLTALMLPEILANPLGLIAYTYNGERFYDHLFEIDGEQEKNMGNWKVMASKPSPVDIIEVETPLPDAILYDETLESYILYGNSPTEILLWQ